MRHPRFTAVPHEVIDQHMAEMTGAELKVLLIVLRKSHGWNRETGTVSLRDMGELAGISSGTCCDAVKALVERGLISKTDNFEDNGGKSASTYEPLFEDAENVRPSEHLCSEGRTPPVRPAERYKEERKSTVEKEEIPPPPFSFDDLNLEDSTEEFLANHSRRNRGPRVKLNRKQDAHILGRIHQAEATFGRTEFRTAWVRFVEWWKLGQDEIREPLAYFLGSVKRWAEQAPLSPPVDLPPIQIEPLVLCRDYPADWNRLVPAAVVEWDARRSPTAALRDCTQDPVFCQRFEEICSVAQSIHQARGSEVSWLTLSWALKGKPGESHGWFKLLNDLRWMAQPKTEVNGLKMSKKDQEIAASLLGARQIRARRIERQRTPE